jgi:1,4-alpha-glucan branching enzyme
VIFIFNFSIDKSIPNYEFFVPTKGEYRVVLNSDELVYEGHNRVDVNSVYESQLVSGQNQLSIYSPCRTAIVLAKN